MRNNYPFSFGLNEEGSSSKLCEQFYRGLSEISELETKFIQGFISRRRNAGEYLKVALNVDSHARMNALVFPNNYQNDVNLAFQGVYDDDTIDLQRGNYYE